MDGQHGRSRHDVLVAIDVGTSGARAAALDLDGRRLLEVRRPYPTHSPAPGWAEQDGEAWRAGALGALADLAGRLGGSRVRAISLTGQCPSIVPVDAGGRPVGPGLIYRDNRATAEAALFRERYGDAAIHARTGHLPAAFHAGPKILWLRSHRPDVFRRAACFLQPRDLVALALSGEWATDGSHAAATLLYDLRAGNWDAGLLADLDLDAALFPPVRASWEVVGELGGPAARRTGLPVGLPVVLGGADSQACALGAGVVDEGPISEMAGSSTCLNAAVEAPVAEVRITHYPHVVPGRFTTETGINTTGAAVAWIAGLVYGGRAGRVRGADWVALDAEAAAVPPGADGVLAVPVLADGERDDPELRGAITGLSLRHGRGVLARAMLEGVACEISAHLDLLRAAGGRAEELRVSGGDARLGTWNRVKADVTGIPVLAVEGDAAVTGVAMLAGLGAGVYASVEEAVGRCVRIIGRHEPGPAAQDVYPAVRERYRALAAAAVVRRPPGELGGGEGNP